MSEVRSGAHAAAAAAAAVAVVDDVRQPTAPHHAIEHQYNLGQREDAHSWRFIGGNTGNIKFKFWSAQKII